MSTSVHSRSKPILARWHAAVLALGLAVAAPASALPSFDVFSVELDTGAVGAFGSLEVAEVGGDLAFEIQLTDALGAQADLHTFYFNLAGTFDGVVLLDSNAPNSPYALSVDPAVAGGAGSQFDYGVNFGNGAGPAGNGVLDLATFTLGADQDLAISDLLESSFAKGGGLELLFAIHVQGTDLTDADSETVGVPVPEPSAALLLSLGLGALGLVRRAGGRPR